MVPLAFKHFVELTAELVKVEQRFGPAKEVFQVVRKLGDIVSILACLLDVKRHLIEFSLVLQPAQVVVTFHNAELAQLAQSAKGKVVSVQVKILAVTFFPRKQFVSLV